MPYKRFVEIGRVVLISYGPDTGKLCTIVNVLDHNRVLVDGPEPITGVHRHELNIKRIMLTDIVVPVSLNATQKCARSARASARGPLRSASALSCVLCSSS
jgi:large subunit ribosomal protein L14e